MSSCLHSLPLAPFIQLNPLLVPTHFKAPGHRFRLSGNDLFQRACSLSTNSRRVNIISHPCIFLSLRVNPLLIGKRLHILHLRVEHSRLPTLVLPLCFSKQELCFSKQDCKKTLTFSHILRSVSVSYPVSPAPKATLPHKTLAAPLCLRPSLGLSLTTMG